MECARSQVGSQEGLKSNLDLPYDAGGTGDEEVEAPAILAFYGKAYEANAVVFALDESGSMSNQGRWELQLSEVTRSIHELTSDSDFGVVYYGSRVTAFRRESPVKAGTSAKVAGVGFVTSHQPTGDTCIAEGVIKALQIVRQSASRYRAVIVTSDGRPDLCATGKRATPKEAVQLLQRTRAANPDGFGQGVHTVFVGSSTEKEAIGFMRSLAQLHNGTFRLLGGS
jgi:Mg-chelatase subunit ChlD